MEHKKSNKKQKNFSNEFKRNRRFLLNPTFCRRQNVEKFFSHNEKTQEKNKKVNFSPSYDILEAMVSNLEYESDQEEEDFLKQKLKDQEKLIRRLKNELHRKKKIILRDHDISRRQEVINLLKKQNINGHDLEVAAKFAETRSLSRLDESWAFKCLINITSLIRNSERLNFHQRKVVGILMLYVITNNTNDSPKVKAGETFGIKFTMWRIEKEILFTEVLEIIERYQLKNTNLTLRNICELYADDINLVALLKGVPTSYSRTLEKRQKLVLSDTERCLAIPFNTGNAMVKELKRNLRFLFNPTPSRALPVRAMFCRRQNVENFPRLAEVLRYDYAYFINRNILRNAKRRKG